MRKTYSRELTTAFMVWLLCLATIGVTHEGAFEVAKFFTLPIVGLFACAFGLDIAAKKLGMGAGQ